jgi:GT2 family glycosyltransferase
MDLSIIIPSFNTKQLLRQCLRSLASNAEVIVVDNGSTDGSPQMVAKEFPKVKLIRNEENLGFAKAVNLGIKNAGGKFILILNSDVLAKLKSLDTLLNCAKELPLLGVAGGRLLSPDGASQGSCFYLPTVWRTFQGYWLGKKKFVEKFAPLGNSPQEVEAIVGAVFLIPRSTLRKVGLFNEKYFMYFEDLDYCRRVRKAGLKVYYIPRAEFTHYHGASGKAIPEEANRWLIESSKIYHGKFSYYLINFLIRLGQEWQELSERK